LGIRVIFGEPFFKQGSGLKERGDFNFPSLLGTLTLKPKVG